MVAPSEMSVYQGLSREETLQELLAAIMRLSGALVNSSSGEVQREVRDVVAKDVTLKQIVSALSSDPLKQTDVLAALAPAARDSSLQSLATSLNAILAKLPQAPALDSSLSSLHADVTAVIAKIPNDTATQTTLAAALSVLQSIVTKLSADPATKAAVDAVTAKLSSDPATQTTLAGALTVLQSVLAKLPSDPATKASIDAVTAKLPAGPALDSSLQAILSKLVAAPALDATVASVAASLNTGAAHTDSAAILAKLPTIVPASAMWRYSLSLPSGSSVVKTAVSGQRHYVTGIELTNQTSLIAVLGSLVGVTITVSVLDGSTVIWSDVFAAASKTAIMFGRDAPLVGSANSALTITTSAAGIMANLQGYTAS